MISHKQKILASAGIFLLFEWLTPFEPKSVIKRLLCVVMLVNN